MAVVPAVHDRSRQSGEASLDSQVVWRQLNRLLAGILCHHHNPRHTHTQQSTNPPIVTKYNSRDDNLTFPNLQLNLTPALTLLHHSRPAVDEQNETGGATAIKKHFNFRHTEVQFRHAWESDNYPRSTEILQINQWAVLLIPSGQRQIKCIIDLCNPSICNSSPSGEGVRLQDSLALQHNFYLPPAPSFSPNRLACQLPRLGTGGVSLGRKLQYISAGLDLAQTKDMAFFNQWSPGCAALSPPFSII